MEGKRILQGLFLASLPLAAGFGACGESSEAKETSPDALKSAEVKSTPTKTTEQKKDEAIHAMVSQFGGAVVLRVNGLTSSNGLDVEFTRTDIPSQQWTVLDHRKFHLTSNMAIIPATSCEGTYQFAIPGDQGRSSTTLIMEDSFGNRSDTFNLDPATCTQTVTVDIQQQTSR